MFFIIFYWCLRPCVRASVRPLMPPLNHHSLIRNTSHFLSALQCTIFGYLLLIFVSLLFALWANVGQRPIDYNNLTNEYNTHVHYMHSASKGPSSSSCFG